MTIESNPALAHRLAEESQLRAEQQWLISALNSIKAQRNSLQIERLHLESMKAQMMMNPDSKPLNRPPPATPTPSVEDIMQSAPSSSHSKVECKASMDEEYVCNQEVLNLGVSRNALNNPFPALAADESGEDDYSDVSADDVFLDMNMLMSSTNDDQNDDLDDYILS